MTGSIRGDAIDAIQIEDDGTAKASGERSDIEAAVHRSLELHEGASIDVATGHIPNEVQVLEFNLAGPDRKHS